MKQCRTMNVCGEAKDIHKIEELYLLRNVCIQVSPLWLRIMQTLTSKYLSYCCGSALRLSFSLCQDEYIHILREKKKYLNIKSMNCVLSKPPCLLGLNFLSLALPCPPQNECTQAALASSMAMSFLVGGVQLKLMRVQLKFFS